MNEKQFLLKIIKVIEKLDNNLFVYAYQNFNSIKTNIWWEISISNFDFYLKNQRFLTLKKIWKKKAEEQNIKIIFVCGWKPKEKLLLQKVEENNLIINI